MEPALILVIDDDESIRQILTIQLTHEHYRVHVAENGMRGIEMVREHNPDLVILDIMMPQMDGHEVCRTIRQFSNVPILMLTAKGETDMVAGLDGGADDYVTKPYTPNHLSAKIRALLRRVPPPRSIVTAGNGAMVLDRERRELKINDKVIELTPTEYQLLTLLADNVGSIVSHDKLLNTIWGNGTENDQDSLKVYIWHLRRKLEDNPRQPKILLTEWGVGYRLVE